MKTKASGTIEKLQAKILEDNPSIGTMQAGINAIIQFLDGETEPAEKD